MKRVYAILVLIAVASIGVSRADNPIVQAHFGPDPAPMVYNGTLYAYVGDDIPGTDFYYMTKWRVLSTTDMVNWTDHGSPISLESFEWACDRAWAAQCIERNGKFYRYIWAQTIQNDGVTGKHDVYFYFNGMNITAGRELFNFDYWAFNKE